MVKAKKAPAQAAPVAPPAAVAKPAGKAPRVFDPNTIAKASAKRFFTRHGVERVAKTSYETINKINKKMIETIVYDSILLALQQTRCTLKLRDATRSSAMHGVVIY